jgi:zinc metalloprotease ZmpB
MIANPPTVRDTPAPSRSTASIPHSTTRDTTTSRSSLPHTSGDSIPEWRLVPNDNNIGQRNVYPISGGGTSGFAADFDQLQFMMKNPMLTTVGMKVQITLPAFLQKLGWRVEFLNPGGASFPLRTGESQYIKMKIIPGADFTPADIPANDKTIQLWGYAGGILVGGVSYTLDPTAKPPSYGGGTGTECEKIAVSRLKCLDTCVDTRHEKVRRVRIRKINIDIELDDGSQD